MKKLLSLSALIIGLIPAGCSQDASDPGGREPEALTAITGAPHTIELESYVYVYTSADDDEIRHAIQRQMKSALGALKELEIGIEDRDSRSNIDQAAWSRSRWVVVEDDGTSWEIDRVTYHYRDRALVRGEASSFELHLLFSDYVSRAAELTPSCSDDPGADPGSLWYHFTPGQPACQRAIRDEIEEIETARSSLEDATRQIPRSEVDRRFLTVRATLSPHETPAELYPEYDRLWESATEDEPLLVYSFFGVDSDVTSPDDHGLREYLRFQRALRREFPDLLVSSIHPATGLLDYVVDGVPLDDVSLDDVERWILDDAGYPAVEGSSYWAVREALRHQVVERFAERWIYWQLPVIVADEQGEREATVEIRTFYGEEDGSSEAHEAARNRYLEAFWYGSIFAYTGHSHFGYGPLNPVGYSSWNFDPHRYQVMLVNSCLSYNYYDLDFLEMHPGGTENLDIVVNGLPAYWNGMGEATAWYAISLIDGHKQSWRSLLSNMRVDLSWERGYDPMRAVNGELDNRYSPDESELSVTPRQDAGDWKRTVIFIEATTEPGQDMFIRGGIDHDSARSLGVDCTAENLVCAIPIRHRNLRNPTTRDWKQGDHHLDWYGAERRQDSSAAGTPADWTTDLWPSSWGPERSVDIDGYGRERLNDFGAHYWMVDVDMDCSATRDGWFEIKAYVSGGIGWESDISQPDAPYRSGNHFGRCGTITVLRFDEDEGSIVDFE